MPGKPFGSSVRVTLIAIIGLVLVIGFVASSAISYQVSKNSLREALIGHELPLTSDNIYSEIQRDLLRPVFVASMMADDTFVRDWLIDGEFDATRMVRFLDEIRTQHGMFTSFLISERTRRYYHFSGITQVVSEDDPNDAWYFRVRSMADEHEINVDFNAAQDDALTIFINHRVFDFDGNYIATTGVGLAFDALTKVVDRYKENFSRHIYFVDNDGRIMVRSEGAAVTEANIRDADGLAAQADKLLTEEQSLFEYDRGGETMLVSTRHIPELDWWVIIEQEEAQALEGIRQSLVTNFFVGLAAILVTLVIVLYAVNLFYARLEQKATELAALAEQEATLNRQLKYEAGVKDKFFSIISHDLISPFSAVLMGTEVMAKYADTYSKEKLTETAQMVHERGQTVFGLLRNLLEWARLQIDGATYEPAEIQLKETVDKSIEVLAPTAADKGVELTNGIGADALAFADANIVDTVMRNLISNSIKFTAPGGKITISLADGGSDQPGTLHRITVADTGVGIPKDRVDQIFELDAGSSTPGTAGEPGTGLGLPLCKEMAELNGGTLSVDSVEGEGSQFHFALPPVKE